MNETYFAPIAIFVFMRPDHTRQVLESLARNPEFEGSPLFIYCDGSRNEGESSQVEETRSLVRNWPHPNKTVIERDKNWGFSNSIIDGITRLCKQYGKIIVVEDDCAVSEYFLDYMNSALVKFQEDDRVAMIAGYSFPIEGLPQAFFIKGANIWGWATWERAWDMFESDSKKLLVQLKERNLTHRFDILGSFPNVRLLKSPSKGSDEASWDVRWNATLLLNDKLSINPGRSFVNNIGNDGSGVNCDADDEYLAKMSTTKINLSGLDVVEDNQALIAWSQFHKRRRRRKLIRALKSFRLLIKILRRRLNF